MVSTSHIQSRHAGAPAVAGLARGMALAMNASINLE